MRRSMLSLAAAGRIAAVVAVMFLALLVVPPGLGVAAGQAVPAALPERFTFGIAGGLQVFDYKEKFHEVESHYQSIGPAWQVTAGFRLAERWRINAEYLGSYITEDTETFDNVATVFGLPVTQENDLKVVFHVVDVDVGYSVVKQRDIEWAIVAGWHFYAQDFERSNFKFRVADIVVPGNFGLVSEDVRGQGVKLGTTLDWRLSDRWSGGAGVAGYYLYQVDVDNSEFGKVDSEGWAIRWRLGLDYALTPNVTLGTAYQGHYIRVDEASTPSIILPENRTLAHTVLLRLGLRF